MKNKQFILMVIFIVIVVVVSIWFYYPKTVSIHSEGVRYRLGSGIYTNESMLLITIEGQIHTSLFGKQRYKGIVSIPDDPNPIPQEHRILDIPLNKRGGQIIYSYVEDGMPKLYAVGDIQFDSSFEQAVILYYEPSSDQKSEGSKGWTSEDGVIITVPANDGMDALQLANEIMKHKLGGVTLK